MVILVQSGSRGCLTVTNLFSYLEYPGDNYEENMRKLAANPRVKDGWKLTDPRQ